MRKIFLPLALCLLVYSCKDEQKAADPLVKDATTTATTKPMPSEFADPKYMDMGKQMMKEFEAGNFDAYGEMFADNAVYQWSSGDSLAGKKAIVDYWKDRRANAIETLQLSNDIWLPIKVNVPQRGPDAPGVWLISWHQVNVKYKNGKALEFWVHTDYHYNDKDKVVRVVQYMDRAPINAAMGTK